MIYLYGLFALTLATALGLGWLEVSAANLAFSARYAAQRYAAVALERAQDDVMESVANQVALNPQIANGSQPLLAPTPGPPLPACAQPPCALAVATSVTLAGQTGNGGAANVVALNAQGHPAVAEQRVSATLTATASNGAGAALATVSRRVVLRVFAVPPYVALSSADEPTSDDGNVEDFAGTCDGNAACGGVDNRVHALLRCSNPDQPALCAGAPYVADDSFSSNAWSNANAAAPTWSR